MSVADKNFYKLALIGHPVSHSISPLMHRAALSFCSLSGVYDLIDLVPPLTAKDLQSVFAQGYVGLNVTIPHKQAVCPFLDHLTADASLVRAVNTIRKEPDGSLIGHNTDLGGFVMALQSALSRAHDCNSAATKPTAAIVLGAGGAARAAMWGLARCGFERVVVLARNPAQAEGMVGEYFDERLRRKSPMEVRVIESNSIADIASGFSVVVNATPVGLVDREIPQWIASCVQHVAQSTNSNRVSFLYDMVYGRTQKTAIVELAEKLNLPACDGLTMLINQAALAFEFWTGLSIPPSVIAEAVSQTAPDTVQS